jgi:hypothetical protein
VKTGDTIDSVAQTTGHSIADIKKANPNIPEWSERDIFQAISHRNYIKLSPFYNDPGNTGDMIAARASQYHVTSMLIDPYAEVHGYSPILPSKKLVLPNWAVQTAFDRMHAFFHLGPVLLTTDVPTTKSSAEEQGAAVTLPVSGTKGTWSWFQPYSVQDVNNLNPQYAQMAVQEDFGNQKDEKGPHTFVEGFLQLMGNLGQKQMAQSGA